MKEIDHKASRRWSTGVKRRALSLLCVGAMFSGMLPLSLLAKAQGELPMLSNLILDKVYELEAANGYPQGADPNDTGFAPQVTEYTATAYLSVDSIQVYPFAQSDTAQVTVNGQELNAQGYVEMDVSELGTHDLEVEVTDGGDTNVYTLEINKVESDYRGRVPAVYDQDILQALSVQTEPGNADKLLDVLKKDYAVVLPESNLADGSYVTTDESYWSVPGSALPNSTGTTDAVTLFTVDLGDEYSVSRIRAAFGPSNLGLGNNKPVFLSVQTGPTGRLLSPKAT